VILIFVSEALKVASFPPVNRRTIQCAGTAHFLGQEKFNYFINTSISNAFEAKMIQNARLY